MIKQPDNRTSHIAHAFKMKKILENRELFKLDMEQHREEMKFEHLAQKSHSSTELH